MDGGSLDLTERFLPTNGLDSSAESVPYPFMDRNDPANCRRLTVQEVAEELRFAMRLYVGRVKLGRVTFTEAMDRGLPMLASKVAESLAHHVVFLKKPPLEGHSIPGGHKRED